ncbi:ferric-chelate reductase 1-like isoform X3 [Rana temporaria]|uniref:ferric-chelate reductase 1-like isoform X3 n=1 Tax=Rana temporaria TaxID=8407 RepID=UPI001AADD4D8|nr:ferric-chelate reductase 1-like isoform X3 [Rana temporaria]
MDTSLWCIVITAGIFFPPNAAAYPNGSIAVACDDMMPQHGDYKSQSSSAPYSLTVSKTSYSAKDQIIVTLKNTSADYPIEGFFIQARPQNSNTPMGYFIVNGTEVQTLTCKTAASAVSHTSDSSKSEVKVTWVASASSYTNVTLRATVVANLSIFWTDVVSQSITYAGASHVMASFPILFITVVFSFLLFPRS